MHFIRGKKRKKLFVVLSAIIIGLGSSILPGLSTVQFAQAAELQSDSDSALKVTDFQMVDSAVDSVTLAWIGSQNTSACYYIYQYNETEGTYDFVGDTRENYYTCTGLDSAQKYYFAVRVIDEQNGVQGEFSEKLEVYTKPKKVSELVVEMNDVTGINISWKAVAGALGYEIYRAEPDEAFVLVGTTLTNAYCDTGLSSGTTYRYKVRAYAYVQDNTGAFSSVLKATTLPAKPVIKVKGGENKARITWNTINGASGYYLYWFDGTKYQYLATLAGKSKTSFVHTNLENNEYSKYKVEAFRIFNETEYKSTISDAKRAMVEKQKATVTTAKLYKTKAGFKKSEAYKKCEAFRKNVKYDKSYIIPGVAGTNTDGFYSSNMCPQGLTFAKSYIMLSAYDRKLEENSVIYVMDKSGKKLLLTLTLPNKTHAGGLTYDGYNIWVTQSNKVHAIPLEEIEKIIATGVKTSSIEYKTTCELTHAASALTYYKGMLWVASYDELSPGYLGAYEILDKKGTPMLNSKALIRITTRVQGLTFTGSGELILSRSCQTDAGKRGFLHVLDVYKPSLSKLSKGEISIGELKKSVEMPTMNEEIAISGNYLYVNFESAAFSTAVERMDRVCAFKTTAITG